MENTQIAEKQQTWPSLISETLEANVKALPQFLNKEKFALDFIELLKSQPSLARNKNAALTNMLKAATLGLSFSDHDAYVVPYGSDFQFQISYQGMIKLVTRYSIKPVKNIYAKVVRKDDEFSEEIVNGQPTVNFKPKPFNDNDIIGVFAVCLFDDGSMIYDTMSFKEIMNIKKCSKTGNSNASPWTQHFGEMAKKSIIRRLVKHIPVDMETAEMKTVFNEEAETDYEIPKSETPVENPFADVRVECEVVND